MIRKLTPVCILFLLAIGGYWVAFKTAPRWWPVTANGPSWNYDQVFAPLIRMNVETEPFLDDALDQEEGVEMEVDWVNHGNGYVYLIYKGREFRVDMGPGFSSEHEGTKQRVSFTQTFSTDETFHSRSRVQAHLE